MHLDWFEDFLVLAEVRNFSRAARRRNITQPAFGRRIRSLEQWVGTGLFIRSGSGTTLSAAGEQFRQYIEAPIRDLHRARQMARDAALSSRSVLTIAATHSLSFSFFPAWIARHAPHEAINLKSDSMSACEQMMLSGAAPLLLSHHHHSMDTALTAPDFLRVPVGEDILVPVCRNTDAGGPRWTLGDDEDVPFLAYGPESGLGRILAADWRARGISLPLTKVFEARLAAAVLSLAEDGLGVGWVPQSLAEASACEALWASVVSGTPAASPHDDAA